MEKLPPLQRAKQRLKFLYGDRGEECFQQLVSLLERYRNKIPQRSGPLWSEKDAILITYGDQVRCDDVVPLACLERFLQQYGLAGLISTIHILPFFPYSSDDGFSVIDYRRVNPELGSWEDIKRLGQNWQLMFDLVLNHVSRQSEWFKGYLEGREPYVRYFIEVDPNTDLSTVVRPRSTPLLTAVQTSRGKRWVWTTFSDDQIDLNWAEPAVLLEMIDIFLFYLTQGARIIRLDAIAYLWKKIGTPCIHLEETHQVVKLLRDIVDEVAPGTIILTETNVPHRENVSYFGQGDEAHMVYQFTLAPLLLEALLSEDGTYLKQWLDEAEDIPRGMTTLNFTASHDGIGVRGLEGILPSERVQRLYDETLRRGGRISTRRTSDGTDVPYELNITYYSALCDPDQPDPVMDAARFLCSQAFMLSMRGMPGIYFHSLVATPNYYEGVKATGRARSINRRKFHMRELTQLLANPNSQASIVLRNYKRLLAVRQQQPAFHPEAAQQTLREKNPAVVAFLRRSLDGAQKILVLANLSRRNQAVDVQRLAGATIKASLLGGWPPEQAGGSLADIHQYELAPYEVAWLIVE